MDEDREPRWDTPPAQSRNTMPDDKPDPTLSRRSLWGAFVVIAIVVVLWLILR